MARLRHGAGSAIAPAPAGTRAEIFSSINSSSGLFTAKQSYVNQSDPDVALIQVNALSTKRIEIIE
jgi:hypothetical protein